MSAIRPDTAAPALERLPILVGIVGKVAFDQADPAADQACLRVFADRFLAVVEYIDRRLPLTPKVLLCGGAAGVDQTSAAIVLERDGTGEPRHFLWSVVFMLPVDCPLFMEDFRDKPQAERRFRELANDPRTTIKAMQPLLREPFDDTRLEPADLPRVRPEELSRHQPDRIPRREHYEQLGLWLARSATLLIAAMPAGETAAIGGEHLANEPEAKLGGTARAVAFRRTGMPDRAAASVLERSSQLLTASPVEEPDGGFVLLIDPTRPAPPISAVPAEVLRPIQRVFDIRDGRKGPDQVRRELYVRPGQDPYEAKDDTARLRLEEALSVAIVFERFHSRQLPAALWLRHWVGMLLHWRCPPAWGAWTMIRGLGMRAEFGDDAPADFLNATRGGALDRQQRRALGWYLRLLYLMIAAFVAAVLCYEIYTEIRREEDTWLLGHVVLILAIAATAWIVQLVQLQVRDENYRGLKEMLRVQIAWWDAGIHRMVDRIHLRSIDTDLRLLREAAATIALWAQLRCREFQPGRIVNGQREGRRNVLRWMADQANYFGRSSPLQRGFTLLAEHSALLALFGSMLSLLGLWWLGTAADEIHAALSPFNPWMAAAFVVAGCFIVDPLRHGHASLGPTDSLTNKLVRRLSLALRVLLIAAWVWGAAAISAPHIAPWLEGAAGTEAAFHALVLVAGVLLLTLAGMARYYSETRNHSAQAAHYDDMLRAFLRATDWLKAGATPFGLRERELIKEMGELALDENEAWLKAHRDRPTRPITPG